MLEPTPENIDGTVVEKHSFEHRVNWSHVALGVGMLAVAYVVHRVLADRNDDEDETGVSR
jgi:hypothetical protein